MRLYFTKVIMMTFITILWINAQIIFKKPLSKRVVKYDISVKLDTNEKLLNGKLKLTWKNTTLHETDELYFHLYLNAFKNAKSTFNRESGGSHRGNRFSPKHRGWNKITSCKIEGKEYADKIEFVRPDDDNIHDSTVVKLKLPFNIKPGKSVTLELQFEAKLPKVYARTGFYDNFFMIGQWFPKIGVLEESGWNCHQFHANSEFYADFGVYDVSITVPSGYVVGATGILTDSLATDSTVTLTYRAEDVHDFAWTTSPDYRKETRNIRGVDVELLYQPEHADQVERYFIAIDHGLHYYGDWYMPYPYPKLTMVDPPLAAMGAGGMEYPMFITCGSIWHFPSEVRYLPEMVTIHEFGHQYFYGIIASNEFEEAWLDEGMNTYTDHKVMTAAWGLWNSLLDFKHAKMGSYDSDHAGLIKRQRLGVIYRKSWEYATGGDYSFNSYSKSTLLLTTLENYLGHEVMAKIWKEYFKQFAFKHPKTEDFIKIVNRVSGKNMDWFFEQYLYGDNVLDYRVRYVTNKIRYPADTTDHRKYLNKIYLQRNSDGVFPVDIRIVFSTGDTLYTRWEGKEDGKVLKLAHEGKVVEVQIDPEMKNYLDINFSNNSWRKNNKRTWIGYLRNKYFFLIQNLFLTMTN